MYLTAHVIGETCRLCAFWSCRSAVWPPVLAVHAMFCLARNAAFVRVTFTGARRRQKCEQSKQQRAFTSTRRRVRSLNGDRGEIQILLILNLCFYELVSCFDCNITNHFIFFMLKEVLYLWFPASLNSVENCCVLTGLSLFAEPLWSIYWTFMLSVSVNKKENYCWTLKVEQWAKKKGGGDFCDCVIGRNLILLH